MSKRIWTKEEQKEAKDKLRKLLKPGDTIYTITRHVSQSGMYRAISLFIAKKNKIICIDWLAQRLLYEGFDYRHDGLKASGCGMDMHFALVYDLGRILYPKGFKLAKNQCGRNGNTSGYDKDGGYAFRKESF